MVIEYQIKRFDLVKSYFYNLAHSKRTQFIIFGLTVLMIVISLLRSYRNHGNLTLSDFIAALLSGLGLILVIPVLSFLTAETQKRTLSITQEGIETKIGTRKGTILWKAIDSVVSTEDRIFITGKNANTFTIPSSAFSSDELRNKFFELATQYHENSKR